MSNLNLDGVDFKLFVLTDANLSGASLVGANLETSFLQGANLTTTDLASANLKNANMENLDLSKTTLSGADLEHAHLQNTNLIEQNLEGVNLHSANLENAELQDADLQKASLSWANLSGTNLTGANLEQANLSWSNLKDAKLHGANLKGADLDSVGLEGTDLREVNLEGVEHAILVNLSKYAEQSGLSLPDGVPEGQILARHYNAGENIAVFGKGNPMLIEDFIDAQHAKGDRYASQVVIPAVIEALKEAIGHPREFPSAAEDLAVLKAKYGQMKLYEDLFDKEKKSHHRINPKMGEGREKKED